MSNSGGKLSFHRRSGERGQTIVLVAVSLVTLLAMAALAIDVVTLYVARSEMQRAADAAALAGAKAFVDSGVTSLATTDPNYATVQGLAQTMATTTINSIVPQNRISGTAPVLVGTPAFDFTRPGDPQVSVTLQRADLPTFFSRIWGRTLSTVTATAVAEAYNPSNAAGGYPPITPKCVKPLLVANQDPTTTVKFIDPTTGAPQATGVVGEQITLYPACTGTGGVGTCTALTPNPPTANSPVTNPAINYLNYIAAQVTPNANNLCPSCQGAPDFEQSIECCDFNSYQCGASTLKINVDTLIRHGQLRNYTNNGVQCLINGGAKDTLDPASLPELTAGTGPARITAGSGPHSGNLVTTSNSIANLPIVDTTNPITTQVTVLGFLQVFVDNSVTVNSPPAGFHTEIQAHILNVVGCGNSPGAGPPVLGGGVSPIPVRLIHQ